MALAVSIPMYFRLSAESMKDAGIVIKHSDGDLILVGNF